MNGWGALVALMLAGAAAVGGYTAGGKLQADRDRAELELENAILRQDADDLRRQSAVLEDRAKRLEGGYLDVDDRLRFPAQARR